MTANRRQILQGAAAASFLPLDSRAREPDSLALWYRQPAVEWTEALPIGNGRLGAMVFGGVADDHIQINEGTLWGGSPHDYTNPGARIHLARLRNLIFSGDVAAAEALTSQMMGNPPLLMPYQPLCDLHLAVDESGVEDYRRSLSLDEACATVTYRAGGVRFHREVFVSHPDQVMTIRLTSDQPGRQSLSVALDSAQPGGEVAVEGDTLTLNGQVQPRTNPPRSWTGSWDAPGLRYSAKVRVRAEGGSTTAENGRVVVRGADAVTILFSAATSFRSYNDIGGDALGQAGRALAAAWPKSFDQLRAAHLADHQKLFRRVTLDLGPAADRPTDQRIADAKMASDPALAALYFQFGRYLLLSSSRPGGQPANLQGLWNPHLLPPWGSKWTTNINLQMNYWLAEVAGLWETLDPLWDLIGDLERTGAVTAATHYGAGGWVLHHNTDLWRATTPVDGAWGIWPMGAVWLAHQMWDHYRFSLDRRFLEDRAWPAMRGAVRFVLDTPVEAPAGTRFAGKLVTNPSFSPENSYFLDGKKAQLTYAATMDLQLIGELFSAFVETSKLLERDAEMRMAVLAARERLHRFRLASEGNCRNGLKTMPRWSRNIATYLISGRFIQAMALRPIPPPNLRLRHGRHWNSGVTVARAGPSPGRLHYGRDCSTETARIICCAANSPKAPCPTCSTPTRPFRSTVTSEPPLPWWRCWCKVTINRFNCSQPCRRLGRTEGPRACVPAVVSLWTWNGAPVRS